MHLFRRCTTDGSLFQFRLNMKAVDEADYLSPLQVHQPNICFDFDVVIGDE
jgi:hypothetical protein